VSFEFVDDSGKERFTGGTWKSVALEELLNRIEMVTDVSFSYNGKKVTVRHK
jgi:hypothetical protein